MIIAQNPLEPDDSIQVRTNDYEADEAAENETGTRHLGRVPHADVAFLDAPKSPLEEVTGSIAAPTVATTRSAYVAPWKRKRAPRRIDPYQAGRLRQQVSIPYPCPPDSVVAARRTALDAIDTFDDAVRRAEDVGIDAEIEAQRNDNEVADAVRAGKPVPSLRRTDWVSEGVVRRVAHEEAYKMAIASVEAFGAAAEEAKPEWRARLVDQVTPAREAARNALQTAGRAVREWRAAVDAADRLGLDLGLYEPYTHQSAEVPNQSLALAGLAEAEKLVFSDDPVVSGAYLTRDDADAKLVPPAWTRDALRRQAERGVDAARWALADIDVADREGRTNPDWAKVLLGGGPSVQRLD